MEGPADFRRPVAIYLAFASRYRDLEELEQETSRIHRPAREGYVPPEIESAIKKADAEMLRLYAVAIYTFPVEKIGISTTSVTLGLKMCRERVKSLKMTKEEWEEYKLIEIDPYLDPSENIDY